MVQARERVSSEADSERGTVLHLIDTDGPGGAESVFVTLVEGLARRGWDCVPAVTEEGWSSRALEKRGLEPVIVRSSGGWDAVHLSRLWSLMGKERVDLVQAHLLGPALYGSLAARLRGIPAAATFHGTWDFRNPGSLLGVKRRVLETCLDVAVFVSRSLRTKIVGEEGAACSMPTAVIPNGIDTSRFNGSERKQVRSELGVTGEDFLVGTVGNLRPAKSHRTFLRLAARLRQHDDRYRFVVVGDTSVEAFRELRTLQAELGLEDCLDFTGYRSDVGRIMGGLDVFVLTSRSEGFSLTTVEAMASGLPVVATRCGGPEEIIEQDRTGVLVNVGQLDEMARAVEEVRASPALGRRLGDAARRHVVREYSRSRMIDSYETLYRDLLEAGRFGQGN